MNVLLYLLMHRVLLTSAMAISIINITLLDLSVEIVLFRIWGGVFVHILAPVFSEESGHLIFTKYSCCFPMCSVACLIFGLTHSKISEPAVSLNVSLKPTSQGQTVLQVLNRSPFF